MKYPVISNQRVATEKSLTRRVGLPNTFGMPDNRGVYSGIRQVSKRINQTKSRNYAMQDAMATGKFDPLLCNSRVVYDVFTMPIPVYINVDYKITVRTEYQQHMNTIMAPFLVYPGGINEVMLYCEGHRFPGFIQESFGLEDNVTDFTNEERKFQSSFTIKVLGYLIGSDKNENTPIPSRTETIVEVQLPRERIMYGALGDYEELYGHSSMDRFSKQCCPTRKSALPERFGRFGGEISIDGSAPGQAVGNIVQVQQVVDDRMGEVLVFREFLNQVGGNVLGNGNLHFGTTNQFRTGSETLFWNGQLLFPGLDYVVWDGQEPNKPLNRGISIVDQRPPPDGQGEAPSWLPPQTAEEKGHQPFEIIGEYDENFDDILLISYIKA